MPFHVELRQGLRRASAFNLDDEKLRRMVVEPWRRGEPVELGDKEWDPAESMVRIVEGSALSGPDLAMGQGWHNAERSGRDVTADILEQAAARAVAVAVLAETPAVERSLTELLGGLGAQAADWPALRARILATATVVGEAAQQGLEVGAAVLVLEGTDPTDSWLFDAGLLLGALGGRAIIAQLGDQPPPSQLQGLGVIRLDLEQPATWHALAERLRAAGCPLGKARG